MLTSAHPTYMPILTSTHVPAIRAAAHRTTVGASSKPPVRHR